VSRSAIVTADDRTRVPLSKLGAQPKATYQAQTQDDGTIVLTPLAMIPARELLVWENEGLREALLLGLAQASSGQARPNPDLDADVDQADAD